MKTSKVLFLILFCGVGVSAAADSFLTAQSFPEPFKNASFGDKMEFESKDYAQYAPEYDKDTGQCIKNCPFPGLNVKTREESIELGLLIDPEELEDEEDTADIVFDENGNCISGCEEENITYEELVENIDQAGADFADIINQYGPSQPGDFPVNAPAWCTSINSTTKLPLRSPLASKSITGDFGSRSTNVNGRNFHYSIDLHCSKNGDPVYATADGIVRKVRYDEKLSGGGWYVEIEHAEGLSSQYMHLNYGTDRNNHTTNDRILVKEGDRVKACQQIAQCGNSGTRINGGSYGWHLDYRVRFMNNRTKYVDVLYPCKSIIKKKVNHTDVQESVNTGTSLNCEHSALYSSYRFASGNKKVNWRLRNGHCNASQPGNPCPLPDEVR